MADLLELTQRMHEDGQFATVARNPLSQFRDPRMQNRRYIGAELLPDRLVAQNMYREYDVRFRTVKS